MATDIHSFTSQFRGGGARFNLFQVEVTNPVDSSQDSVIPFRCRASMLPTWRTEEIPVKFMGRSVFYSGVRQHDQWTTTILEDSDYKVRNALESWQNWINLQAQNVRGFTTETEDTYKTVGKVRAFDKLGNNVREYTLFGLWPTTIADIRVDWEQDGIVTYDVQWRYDYFEVSGGTSGNAADPGTITSA